METTKDQEERRSTLRLPSPLARSLRIEAAKQDTSVNALVRAILQKWVDRRKG